MKIEKHNTLWVMFIFVLVACTALTWIAIGTWLAPLILENQNIFFKLFYCLGVSTGAIIILSQGMETFLE